MDRLWQWNCSNRGKGERRSLDRRQDREGRLEHRRSSHHLGGQYPKIHGVVDRRSHEVHRRSQNRDPHLLVGWVQPRPGCLLVGKPAAAQLS